MQERPDHVAAPTNPLAAAVRARLASPELRALARKLFGFEPGDLSAGWPRQVQREALRSWLRADDVLIELVRVPQDGVTAVGVLVPAPVAAALVDRVLGGEGEVGHTARLREAELGVLAYACARLSAAGGLTSWQVRDARAARAEAWGISEAWLVWPLSLAMPQKLDLRLVMVPAAAAAFGALHPLALVANDALAPGALDGLEPGDVLLSDALPLTLTGLGLEGAVELALAGTEERWSALLSRGGLCVGRALPPRPIEPRVDVVLARGAFRFEELAAISAGWAPPLTPAYELDVALQHEGERVAEGALIVHRGALGVRVARVFHSMR